MPTPEGVITGTEIWTEPASEPVVKLVEEALPLEEEDNKDEL